MSAVQQQSGLLLAYIQVQLIQNVAIHLSLPSSHFQLIWRAWYWNCSRVGGVTKWLARITRNRSVVSSIPVKVSRCLLEQIEELRTDEDISGSAKQRESTVRAVTTRSMHACKHREIADNRWLERRRNVVELQDRRENAVTSHPSWKITACEIQVWVRMKIHLQWQTGGGYQPILVMEFESKFFVADFLFC